MSDLDTYLAGLTAKIQATTSAGYISDEYVSEGINLRERAPNAIKWIAGEKFLNIPSIYEHTRQYQIVRDFFQLRCPICNRGSGDCWGRTEAQLKAEVLLEWDAHVKEDRCPKCETLRSELIADGLLRAFETMVGCAGMRSGKSVVAAMIGTYFRHVYTTMGILGGGALHKAFHLLATQPLEIAFVATTQTQSQQTIWANFFNQCKTSPWFKAYIVWVKKREDTQATPRGARRWAYKELDDVIEDPWCMLNCVSLNSNSGGMAGRTRLAFFIDELSRFGLGDSKMGADEVWAVFDHSLLTVRGAKKMLGFKDPWLGTAIAISSPISIEDKTMRLIAQADQVTSIYAWRYATWDFNPFQPRENFNNEFALDAVTSERDFGANPPNATSPLIEDPLRFWSCLDDTAKPTATFFARTKTDKSGKHYVAAELDHSKLDHRAPLYIFGDAGKTFDQFALVACSGVWLPALTQRSQVEQTKRMEAAHFGGIHPDGGNETSQGGYYQGGPARNEDDPGMTLVTYHEWSLRIIPEPDKPVWFESVLDIIKKILKYRKIAMVAFDHWNSASTLQSISNLGVPTSIIQLQVPDFVRMTQDAMLGRLRLLPPTPDDKLSLTAKGSLQLGIPAPQMTAQAATLYELLRLERSEDLKKVFNPKKGLMRGWDSDDCATCLVGSHRLVQESAGKVKNDTRNEKLAKETGAAATFVGGLARSRW